MPLSASKAKRNSLAYSLKRGKSPVKSIKPDIPSGIPAKLKHVPLDQKMPLPPKRNNPIQLYTTELGDPVRKIFNALFCYIWCRDILYDCKSI